MRFLKRAEKHLAQSGLFGSADRRRGRRLAAADAILVGGFWRSGTTLLLDLVSRLASARAFFEPLHFRVPPARRFHGAWRIPVRGRSHSEVYPYVSATAGASALDAFLEDMLCGRISTKWTRKARRAPSLLRSPVVVKLVRGNLLMAYAERRFGCRCVFIVRHPCAVVASLFRGRANREVYSSEGFLQILLEQEALKNDFLLAHREHIERHKRTALGRLALAHAITHWVPLQQMARGLWNPCLVHFEELVLNPHTTIERVAGHLLREGQRRRPQRPHLPDSLTTQRSRERLPPERRSYSWKDELPPKDIDAILAVHAGFGPPLSALWPGVGGIYCGPGL